MQYYAELCAFFLMFSHLVKVTYECPPIVMGTISYQLLHKHTYPAPSILISLEIIETRRPKEFSSSGVTSCNG